MPRRALVLLLLFALLLPTVPAPPSHAQNPCDGLVTPRLTVGGTARVVTTYGLSLKDRPATGAAGGVEVRLLTYDTVAQVVGGYQCRFGYVWWQLQLPDGTQGWAAEGGAAGAPYFLEPLTVGLHVYRPNANRTQIAHYFVTAEGVAEPRGTFAVALLSATPAEAWQEVERQRLRELLSAAQTNCPQRLRGTPFEGLSAEQALALPLPPLEYDFYPAPNGDRLLLVRHQHLLLPRCHTVIPERVGMSTVSVLSADGSEQVLFPFPQHGAIPSSEDEYAESEPSPWQVYLAEVVWSPSETHIAFVAAYRDRCGTGDCFRFHVYVANLETGELYILGEGRHIGWAAGGASLNVFRLVSGAEGARQAHLFTMRPNGWERQEIWLPGGAVYVSDEERPLGFPWNAGGTRVMVANKGLGEVMLFELANRAFTPAVTLPPLAVPTNRLSVHLVSGESAYLWTTIRGDFVLQDARNGSWRKLQSTLATSGVAPRRVRIFPSGNLALIEMADGSAWLLDYGADALRAVAFP